MLMSQVIGALRRQVDRSERTCAAQPVILADARKSGVRERGQGRLFFRWTSPEIFDPGPFLHTTFLHTI